MRLRDEGFVDGSIRTLFDHLPATLGHAFTVRVSTRHPKVREVRYVDHVDWAPQLLALPERPGLAKFRLQPITQLELGHGDRPVLAVALRLVVAGESMAEDREGCAHDFAVRKSDQPCTTWTEACVTWMRYKGFLKRAKE